MNESKPSGDGEMPAKVYLRSVRKLMSHSPSGWEVFRPDSDELPAEFVRHLQTAVLAPLIAEFTSGMQSSEAVAAFTARMGKDPTNARRCASFGEVCCGA